MNKDKAFCKHNVHIAIRCFQCEADAKMKVKSYRKQDVFLEPQKIKLGKIKDE